MAGARGEPGAWQSVARPACLLVRAALSLQRKTAHTTGHCHPALADVFLDGRGHARLEDRPIQVQYRWEPPTGGHGMHRWQFTA